MCEAVKLPAALNVVNCLIGHRAFEGPLDLDVAGGDEPLEHPETG